ncbi:hypothetical protein DAVIS_00385 [Mycobacterium marinum]|uniref:Uncharacterized protein n=1 Tax=Mycobacterium marinum TaxID=1781 RepID=A0A3E2N2R1_MYCMR|nr:hypothetical protein DAVIS_00385 [Mycobacterium marinum]
MAQKQTKPRMPRGLGTEGQKLWQSVVAAFELTATDDPDKLRILFDACQTADLVKRLGDAAAKATLTVRGSMGQEVINPLIAQAQSSRMQLAQLLGRLNFTSQEDN